MKKTIVYLNPDCFADTDLTVLKHLTKEFRVIWYYIHESKKTNNQITVEHAMQYAQAAGIEICVRDPKCRLRSYKNLLFYANIAREINKISPDAVFHCNRNPYWCLAVKFILKCKCVILGVHDAQAHTRNKTISSYLDTSTRGLSIKVHRHFVTFSKGQQLLFKEVYGNDSCLVGMSCKDFGKSTLELKPISEGIKLLFFGGIHEYKGLDLLVSSLEKLRAKGIANLFLTIAGNGDSWKKCKNLIQTQEMYNLQIRFIGNNEIPDLMSSHHFLVLPYRDATQSGPLATAVAYELPVIAPDFGCFSETYSHDSAILYPQGHLDEALTKASKLTEGEYVAMKEACKKVKVANGEERIAQNYIDCFKSLIK